MQRLQQELGRALGDRFRLIEASGWADLEATTRRLPRLPATEEHEWQALLGQQPQHTAAQVHNPVHGWARINGEQARARPR